MKTRVFLLVIFVAAPALGQNPPPLMPVDDVSKLADPANRTIERNPLQKNLVSEKTPSGMTVYREVPAPPPPAPSKASASTAMTPEETKMFREAEQRARRRTLEQPQPPAPQEDAALPSTAHLSALFDIEKHCKHIRSMATGGSYTLELACRKNEREAFGKLSAMSIPPEIEKHCAHIGSMSTGGSYNLMHACVKQEIEAKKNLR